MKRRNAAAKALSDPRYRKRVVKSKKTYSRKGRLKWRPKHVGLTLLDF